MKKPRPQKHAHLGAEFQEEMPLDQLVMLSEGLGLLQSDEEEQDADQVVDRPVKGWTAGLHVRRFS